MKNLKLDIKIQEIYQADLKKILDFFGKEAQERKLLEEIEEFVDAITELDDFLNYKNQEEFNKLLDHTIEEIADCMIVATQIEKTEFVCSIIDRYALTSRNLSMSILSAEVIKRHVEYKLKRTLDLIEKIKQEEKHGN